MENKALGLRRGWLQQSLYRSARADRAAWIIFGSLMGTLVASVAAGVHQMLQGAGLN